MTVEERIAAAQRELNGTTMAKPGASATQGQKTQRSGKTSTDVQMTNTQRAGAQNTSLSDYANKTASAASQQRRGSISEAIVNQEAARSARQAERAEGESGSIRRAVYEATQASRAAERNATRAASELVSRNQAAIMNPQKSSTRPVSTALDDYNTARQQYTAAKERENDLRQNEWVRRWQDQYGNLSRNEDFAERSRTVNQNERDTTYRYINQIGGFDRLVEQAGQNSIANPMAKYRFMTPDERATYNYVYNTQGIDAARGYLEGLDYALNARQVDDTAQFYAEEARKDPISMSAVTPIVNLMGGIGQVDAYAQAALKRRNDYKPVDYNRAAGAPSRFVSAVREAVSDEIDDPVGAFLYNTGMSMADFVVASLIGGGGAAMGAGKFAKAALGNIPTTMIGMSAGTQAMNDAVKSGATDAQAVGLGIAASLAEIVSEKVSLGMIMKAVNTRTLGQFLAQLLKNGGVEASEEAITTLANTAADMIIRGDKNDWTRAVLEYQKAGYSSAEAQKMAFNDWFKGLALDALGGALSGVLLAGGASGFGYASNALDERKAGLPYEISGERSVQKLINENLQARSDTEARKLAEKLKEKSDKGQRISTRELGRLDQYARQDEMLDRVDEMMGLANGPTRRTGGIEEAMREQQAQQEATTAPETVEQNTAPTTAESVEAPEAADVAMPAQEQTAPQEEQTVEQQMEAEPRMAAPAVEVNEQTEQAEQTAPEQQSGTTVQQAQEIARQENVEPASRRLDGTKAHPNAGFDYSHASTAKYVNDNLSARDAAQIDAFAKQLGLRVRYAPYGTVAGGNANAMINGNEVVFEEGNENPYQFLAGHEFGHRMKQLSTETWGKFEDFAKNTEWGKERYEQTVRDYEARNMSLPENIWEEVACDYAGRLLLDDYGEDSGLIGDLIRENRSDPGLLQRILEVLREIAERLSGREKTNAQKAIGLLEDAYRAAVRANAQSETGVQTETEEYMEQPLVGEEALVPNEMLSIKSLNQDTAEGKMFQDLVAAKVMTKEEADALRDSLLDLLKYIEDGLAQQYKGVLTQDQILRLVDLQEEEGVEYEFDADGNIIGENDTRRFHPFKPNSDKLYKISLDYSTLCQKRVFMQAVIESLQEQEKKALSGQDVMTIRELLKKAKSTYSAIQVACAMCYVESRRMGAAKFINNFLYTGEIDGKHAVNRASIIKDYFAKKDLDGIMARVKEEQARYKTDVVGVSADASKKAMQKAIREKQLAWKAERGYPETYNGYNIEQRVASETAKKRWLRSRSLPENATEDQIKGVYGKEGVKQFRDVKPDEFALEAGKNARAEYDGLGNMNIFNEIAPSIRAEYKPTKAQDKVIARAMKLPESTFLTAKNLANLKGGDNVDQQIYAAFTEYVRTASRQKGLEEDVAYYYGDSRRGGTTVSDQFIESVNEENGMRFSSWSDAQVQHILDNMVAIIEMSVRNVMMHGYTKFPWIVDIFGNTGAMYNMSGVPSNTGLDENGNLEFDPTDSVPIEEAKKMRDKYPETAGIQCIGATVEHVRALLRSDFIDYVIPYHISGLSEKLRLMAGILGWTDFEKYQEASVNSSIKKGNKSTWLTETIDKEHWHEEPVFSEFFVGYDTGMSGIDAMKASAQNYIRMCFERGMTPKFALFLDEENYWKLLIDRKMINQKTGELIKQKPVRPDFNFDSAKGRFKQELDDYLAFVQDNENNPEGKAPEQIALDVILKAKESGEFAAIEKSLQKSDENTKRPSKADTAALAEAKSRSYQEAADRVWEKRRESDAVKAEELSRLADEKVKQQVAILNNTMLANMVASSAQQSGTKLSVKSTVTPQMDADYMAAVERGDMETAQKMVDEAARRAGYTIKAYHGTGRADRVGTVFRPDRATSGPMAFFTDNREIADRYSKDKRDTSISYDTDYDSYETQFRAKHPGTGRDFAIYKMWGYIPLAERTKIAEKAKHIRIDVDGEGEIIYDPDATEANGGWDWQLKQFRGDVLKALNEQWLNSGNLFNVEENYLKVLDMAGVTDALKKAGFDAPRYMNPDYREEKVYDVFLRIRKPFDVANKVNEEFIQGFEEYAERNEKRYTRESAGSDFWDKNSVSAETFAERMRDDLERGSTHAWTSIPDVMTAYLKRLKYDGIKDQGGKNGGDTHTVWIPFSSEQVKSADPVTYDKDNKPIPLSERFNREEQDIRYSVKSTNPFAPTYLPDARQSRKTEPAQARPKDYGKLVLPDARKKAAPKKPSYSLKGSDYNSMQLQRENKALRDLVEYWKKQTKLTEQATIDSKAVERTARALIREYNLDLDVEDISKPLQRLYDYIASGKDGDNELTYEAAREQALAIAEAIVENTVEVDDEMYREYKDLREHLRTKQLQVTPYDTHEISDFSSRRKAIGPKIRIKQGDVSNLDQYYSDLSAEYPEFFPEDSTDQLNAILTAAEKINTVTEYNPFEYNAPQAVNGVANDILDKFWDLPQTKATFADKMNRKLIEARAQTREVRETKDRVIAALKRRNREQKEQARWDIAAAAMGERIRSAKQLAEFQRRQREKDMARRDRQSARELRGKITRQANRLSTMLKKPNDKSHVPEEFRSAVAAALASINLSSSQENPTKRTEAFLKLRAEYDKIANEESGVPITFDNELADNLATITDPNIRNTPLMDMTIDQLQSIYDAIRAVVHAVQTANKAFAIGRAEEISEITTGIYDDTIGRKSKRQFVGALGKIDRLVNTSMMTPITYFHLLGETGDSIFDALRRAQDKYIRIIEASVNELRGIAKSGVAQKWDQEKQEFDIDGEKLTLTTSQMMDLYLLLQRPQAVDHIYIGGIRPESIKKNAVEMTTRAKPVHITPEIAADIVGRLTDEQIAVAERLQRYVQNVLSVLGNEASMQVYGYKKFRESNYWPIRVDRNQTVTDVGKEAQAATIPGRGMAKAVKPHANNAVRLGSVFDVFSNHSSDMATYAAWLGPMEDLRRIYNYTAWKDSDDGLHKTKDWNVKEILEDVFGKDGQGYWEKLTEDLNNGVKGVDSEGIDLMGAYKASAIGANIRVWAQQPTAILRAMEMVSPIDMTLAATRIRPGVWNTVKEYSPIAVWKSWGYFETSTGKQMRDVQFGDSTKLNAVQQKLLAPAGTMDTVAWCYLWCAIENETKRTKPYLRDGSKAFYEAVAKRFGEVIDRTQVVDGVLQRSQIMRNTNALTKMATAFMSEPTKVYNMVLRNLYDIRNARSQAAKRSATKHLGRTVFALLASFAANAAVQSLVDALRDDDRDKRYLEKFWTKFFGSIGKYAGEDDTTGERVSSFITSNAGDALMPWNYIPYIKDVASILQGYSIDRMDMESVESLLKATQNTIKAFQGKNGKTKLNALASLIADGSRVVGLPISNIKRDVLAVLNTVAIQSNNYQMQYAIAKTLYTTDNSKNTNRFKAILEDAYEDWSINDANALREQMIADGVPADKLNGILTDAVTAAYKEDPNSSRFKQLYVAALDAGVEEKTLTNKIEDIMKEQQGVSSVNDLDHRFIPPAQMEEYERDLSYIQDSAIYQQAPPEIQGKWENVLGDRAAGYKTNYGDKIDAAMQEAGISEVDYILYRIACGVADAQGNQSGDINKSEATQAVSMMDGLTREQLAWLWQSNGANWKGNPYA